MGVTGLPAEGAVFALPIGAYGVDIDGNGDGWVRVTASGAAGRVDVTFMEGLATDWAGLPEAIRQGVGRPAAARFAQREGGGSAPPAGVSAPWRHCGRWGLGSRRLQWRAELPEAWERGGGEGGEG